MNACNNTPVVVIRADGSSAMGMGHLVRCRALARHLATTGCDVHLLRRPAADLPDWVLQDWPGMQEVLQGSDAGATQCNWTVKADAHATTRHLDALGTVDWVVVDHYGLDASWHEAIRSHCGGLLVIDDLADRPLQADLVLDPNRTPKAAAAAFEGLLASDTRLLAGPAFAMLDSAFTGMAASPQRGAADRHRPRVLICMGGADAGAATAAAAQGALACGRDVHVCVVVGLASSATQLASLHVPEGCTLDVHIAVRDMPVRMQAADLAISAAGSTVWEFACVGVPMVLVIEADNQQAVATQACKQGAAAVVGSLDPEAIAGQVDTMLSQPERLADMAAAGRAMVDGLGVERVVEAMQLA